MKLQVCPVFLDTGKWYVLRVSARDKEMFITNIFTLREFQRLDYHFKKNVIMFRTPNKFQELLGFFIRKFEWYGIVNKNEKLQVLSDENALFNEEVPV